jgi:acyl-coenzyme A synthetase/AMP-(fatty) acid ligase
MYGLETTVMLPLQNGIAVDSGRPLLPADVAAALAELPASRWLVTTPLQLRAAIGENAVFPELAGVLSATMPLTQELAQAVEDRWGGRVHEIYGCTEAGTVALRCPAREELWRVCAGLHVWQSSDETWIAGGHLDRELKLPDYLEVAGEQEFTLVGRPGDMIKIAGKRTSLEALNCELLRIPGVRDGVFFLPEADGTNGTDEQRVAALVVAPKLDAEGILRALRERIDAAFLPRPLIMVDALPRNATGKLAREGVIALARDALAREQERRRAVSDEREVSGAISALHPALAGHFPGNPVVPGVVILERVCRALTRKGGRHDQGTAGGEVSHAAPDRRNRSRSS